ncbi:MAG: DinB family protein [Balneolaceae bacterium]|nr:DinB family protein [Balneolaceae bacterium]
MEDLKKLFNRDLDRLIKEIEEIPEHLIWKTKSGITNSCGVLAQHIAGNLKHFVGAVLGNTGYVRDREREFTNTGTSSEELIAGLKETQIMLQEVLPKLSHDILNQDYPLDIPWDYSAHEFLLHLYGHLNYHRGQVNYLRRIFNEN